MPLLVQVFLRTYTQYLPFLQGNWNQNAWSYAVSTHFDLPCLAGAWDSNVGSANGAHHPSQPRLQEAPALVLRVLWDGHLRKSLCCGWCFHFSTGGSKQGQQGHVCNIEVPVVFCFLEQAIETARGLVCTVQEIVRRTMSVQILINVIILVTLLGKYLPLYQWVFLFKKFFPRSAICQPKASPTTAVQTCGVCLCSLAPEHILHIFCFHF